MSTDCKHCDGWGCSRCIDQPATRARIQAALDELRGKVQVLDLANSQLGRLRNEAVAERDAARAERDRFAEEARQLRSKVGQLKAQLAARMREAAGNG